MMIALVPALIGATGGRTLTLALAGGFQPAMLVMTGLCVVAAVVSAVYVSNERRPTPRIARGPDHGSAMATTDAPAA
jgi:hypothetical protein